MFCLKNIFDHKECGDKKIICGHNFFFHIIGTVWSNIHSQSSFRGEKKTWISQSILINPNKYQNPILLIKIWTVIMTNVGFLGQDKNYVIWWFSTVNGKLTSSLPHPILGNSAAMPRPANMGKVGGGVGTDGFILEHHH